MNNRMPVPWLVVSDIFGITDALIAWSHSTFDEVSLVSPYGEQMHDFVNEQDAYQAFQQAGGITAYCQHLAKQAEVDAHVVGFSAGASAAWVVQAQANCRWQSMTGFYPSQIRHHLGLNPQRPVRLVFPHSEPHFALQPVIDELAQKAGISCQQSPYAHGFMNPHSAGFDKGGLQQMTQWLKSLC